MKRLILFFTFILAACCISAQVATQNYVRTRRMLNGTSDSYMDGIVYYDGLGRPFQTVEKSVEKGQTKSLLGTLQEYDAAGRETNAWLPVSIGSDYLIPATFKGNAPGNYGNDACPYSQPIYEASPLNRVLKQYGPGAAWHSGHPVSTEYMANTAASPLNCICYGVDGTTGALTQSGNYAANRLKVVKVTDEDSHVSYTFTDVQDRTLLERRMKGSEAHDTYYVYDDSDNLCFVLQPQYQMEANLDKFAFQYKYDGFGRCIQKKLPGAQHILYEYDAADRLTFSQNGNQRALTTGNWTYYKYDHLSRLTEQGICTNQVTTSGTTVHVKNYYDDYSFVGTAGFTDSRFTKDTSGYGKGMLTGQTVYHTGICNPIRKAF